MCDVRHANDGEMSRFMLDFKDTPRLLHLSLGLGEWGWQKRNFFSRHKRLMKSQKPKVIVWDECGTILIGRS